MKTICRIMIALCLPLLFCGQARAVHTGPYVGAFFGGNLLQDSKATDGLGSFNLSYNPALQGSIVVGWDLGPGNPLGGEGRIELEYTRRSNPLDHAEFVEGKATGGGDLTVDSLLLNFAGVVRTQSRWSPYVTIGIGAARLDASELKVSGQPLSNDTATTFAYQVGGGVDYALTDSLSLDLGYRFFGAIPTKFTEPNGLKFETDYLSHSIVLGLRLGF
ncbi:MAG TPA: outer membrane beta-barrel protein [Geobacteraceae bacterium]|nr:outer membrane beta-barrel protein [Geobacteraceae bacterium]